MSRLWTGGAELQTMSAGIEITAPIGSTVIETTTKRSGNAAWRINNTGAAEGFRQAHTSAQGSFFFRFYLYIVTLPTGTITIAGARTTGAIKIAIRLTTGGALQLYNFEDSAQVGSDSSALSTATWYRVEMTYDSTTLSATTCSARIDGVEFASGTVDLVANPTNFGCYTTGGDATLDYIVDDLAINDTAGSFQNTWPGEGEVICLRPNGNGDNSAWTGSDGNSTDNYLLVDETPPDSADYVESNTSGQIDDYNLEATPAAMDSSDVINVVHVGAYVAVSDATGADPDIVLRIKASASGTVEESATLDCNSVTYHGPAPLPANDNYQLTLYDLPGASTTAWTKADLDAAQVGVREAVTDTHFARVAAIWVMVDHKPGAGGGDVTVSTSDTVTLSEALTLLVNSYIPVSDTVTLSETATALLVSLISAADTVTLSESIGALLVSLVNASETVTLSEAVLLEIFTSISASETVTLSEAVTMLVTSSIGVSDTVTLTEEALALVISLVSVSEAVTLSEALELLVTSFISTSETITLSEDTSLTVVSAGDTLISVSDTVTLSEAVTLFVLSFISASDTVTLSEALNLLVTSFIATSETITLSEDTSLSIVSGEAFSPSVSDTVTLSEAVSLFVLVQVSASETITLSEAASLLLVSLVDSSDTVTLSETVAALLVSLVSASETVTLSEAITLLVLATIQASETITLSEAATVTLASLISASETITLSETAAALLVSLVSASDTITLSETTSATVGTGINVSETITLSETSTVSVTGAGGEILISVSETITFTETVSLTILIIGLMRVTFSAKQPGVTFSSKRPNVTFTSEE